MSKIEKNWLEWCVFGISLVLVGSVLSYLTYAALSAKPTPPDLEVELGPAQSQHDHHIVPVMVHNRGYQTAEAVRVQVLLTKPDGKQEQADFDIQFMPPRSSRQGLVTFETDPRSAKRLVGRVMGYHMP